MRTWLTCLLLLPSNAMALPWVVPDAQTATRLDDSLARLWSAHDIDVTTNDATLGDRLVFEDNAIVLYAEDQRYEREWSGETDAAVVMVRSWLRDLRVADGGWIPDLPQTPIEPVVLTPATPSEPEAKPRRPWVTLPPAELSAGLGMRLAPANGYGLDGPRLSAGLRSGPVGVHATLFVAAGSYLRESSIDRQLEKLEQLDGYASYLDTFAVSVVGELGMPAPTAGVQAGPVLLGGAEFRRSVLRRVTTDPADDSLRFELDPDESQLDIGPVVGLGVDVWAGARGRLRVAGLDRIRLRRRSPNSQRRWTHDYALTIDVLVLL